MNKVYVQGSLLFEWVWEGSESLASVSASMCYVTHFSAQSCTWRQGMSVVRETRVSLEGWRTLARASERNSGEVSFLYIYTSSSLRSTAGRRGRGYASEFPNPFHHLVSYFNCEIVLSCSSSICCWISISMLDYVWEKWVFVCISACVKNDVLLCSFGKSVSLRRFSESVNCYCVLNTW